jgi:hypothetical protein
LSDVETVILKKGTFGPGRPEGVFALNYNGTIIIKYGYDTFSHTLLKDPIVAELAYKSIMVLNMKMTLAGSPDRDRPFLVAVLFPFHEHSQSWNQNSARWTIIPSLLVLAAQP